MSPLRGVGSSSRCIGMGRIAEVAAAMDGVEEEARGGGFELVGEGEGQGIGESERAWWESEEEGKSPEEIGPGPEMGEGQAQR